MVELLFQKEDEEDIDNEEVHSPIWVSWGHALVAEVSVALSHHSDRL